MQEANWQLLLASSQRQEQLLLKLLERLDTPAPSAAGLAPGQQQETARAAEGGGGGSPDVPASGLRLKEREESAAASRHGDSVACRQPAVGTGTAGTQAQQQQQPDESVRPRLLDYVRVKRDLRIPRSRDGSDPWERGVIPAGVEGVVLASAGGGTRLKVRPDRRTAVCYVRVRGRGRVRVWWVRHGQRDSCAWDERASSRMRPRVFSLYQVWILGIPSLCVWTERPGVLERVTDARNLSSTARRRQVGVFVVLLGDTYHTAIAAEL